MIIALHHPGPVHEWIQRGGYPALFAVLFFCGLGLPVPEDIPLLTAGVLISRGHMTLWLAALCAWCGIIGGDCILYYLGRRFGLKVTRIPIIGRHINVRRIAKMQVWFSKYGVWVVAVGRMFAGVRGVMVLVAGTSKFRFWKFIIADGLAAIVSGGLFMFLGYEFAENLDGLHRVVSHIKGGMLVVLAILSLTLLIFVLLRRQRSIEPRGFPLDHPESAVQPMPPSSDAT